MEKLHRASAHLWFKAGPSVGGIAIPTPLLCSCFTCCPYELFQQVAWMAALQQPATGPLGHCVLVVQRVASCVSQHGSSALHSVYNSRVPTPLCSCPAGGRAVSHWAVSGLAVLRPHTPHICWANALPTRQHNRPAQRQCLRLQAARYRVTLRSSAWACRSLLVAYL